MSLISTPDLPRKRPAQARSVATLETLYEATLQVLVKEGLTRCNTTRVAERAGVSVGTVYQYYSNRRALLAGVLKRHLESVAQAIEQACAVAEGATTGEMGAAIANAFLDAKLLRADASRALYAISESHGGATLVAIARERMLCAVCGVLSSARDRQIANVETVALVLLGAVAGPVRELLEQDYDDATVDLVREQLVNLASGYLQSLP